MRVLAVSAATVPIEFENGFLIRPLYFVTEIWSTARQRLRSGCGWSRTLLASTGVNQNLCLRTLDRCFNNASLYLSAMHIHCHFDGFSK